MLLFPKENEFDEPIKKAGAETGLPAFMLKGFIGLESAFDPKAYRYEPKLNPPDGSYGLAQVLAKTARGFGYQGEDSGLFDPYLSALYGGKFIRGLTQKYSELTDIIAAYNMGFPRKISQTTAFIAAIYRYPIEYREKPPAGWMYANEFYVRRVAAYIAYYQAREVGDTNRAEAIAGLLAKNEVSAVYFLSLPILKIAVKFQ